MNFEIILESAPLLIKGLLMTFKIWLGALTISLILGTLIGIIRSSRLRIKLLSRLLDNIAFVFRGIPFYVQLLIAYYVIPDILGLNLSPVITGIFALGFCSAAYVSQIIKAGINAIPNGQWEAAFSLGLTTIQALFYVIIPQAIRIIIPMLASEFDQLLKSTSIISTIGVLELTRVGMNIVAREMQVVPVYLTIAALYFIISSVLNLISNIIEKKLVSKS